MTQFNPPQPSAPNTPTGTPPGTPPTQIVTSVNFADNQKVNIPVGTIASAQYGAGDIYFDVTNTIATIAVNGFLTCTVNTTTMGCNPCPGVTQTLYVNYTAPNVVSTLNQNNAFSLPFGAAGDIPLCADFLYAGITQVGVFRPSTGTWYIQVGIDTFFPFLLLLCFC